MAKNKKKNQGNDEFDIESLTKNPDSYLESQDHAEKLIAYLDHEYENGVQVVSDTFYDRLREIILAKYPKSKIHQQIGAPVVGDKTKLKYWMGSMDKIKAPIRITGFDAYVHHKLEIQESKILPADNQDIDLETYRAKWNKLSDKKQAKYQDMAKVQYSETDRTIASWSSKYPGPYLVSDKLDGLSCLYDNGRLYTRGDGNTGRDVSHLLEFVKLPTVSGLVVRGEILISKENFMKFPEEKKARTMVGGVVNAKRPNQAKAKYLEFVAYELIEPRVRPSDQLKRLSELGFRVVYSESMSSLDTMGLSKVLNARFADSVYQLDGIIVTQDTLQPVNQSGNPKYAFAFKESGEGLQTEVLDVEWNASMHGLLKPRVRVRPVILEGSDTQYFTGKNAKFIVANGIGPGAIVKVAMGGDVIPDIISVIKPIKNVELPDNCHWNETEVDLLLDEISDNVDVLKKRLTNFSKKMNIEFLGEGLINRLVDHGYDSVKTIVTMTVEDFKTIDGIQDKMAVKLVDSIQKSLAKTTVCQWMVASNCMGSGFGDRKIKAILIKYPDIWKSIEDREILVNKIKKIDGFQTKTAGQFADNLHRFQEFWKDIKDFVPEPLSVTPPSTTVATTAQHPLITGKTFLFTGFRDPKLQGLLESYGGKVTEGSVFDILICKDKSSTSSKVQKAKTKGVPIYQKDEFEDSI